MIFFCCCQVTLCIYALARTTQKHADYAGPGMGPKMATENKRNFSEEQIRQGRDAQVGLQVLRPVDVPLRVSLKKEIFYVTAPPQKMPYNLLLLRTKNIWILLQV